MPSLSFKFNICQPICLYYKVFSTHCRKWKPVTNGWKTGRKEGWEIWVLHSGVYEESGVPACGAASLRMRVPTFRGGGNLLPHLQGSVFNGLRSFQTLGTANLILEDLNPQTVVGWAWRVARITDEKCIRNDIQKPRTTRPVTRRRRKREDNIKVDIICVTGWTGWQWTATVNTVLHRINYIR